MLYRSSLSDKCVCRQSRRRILQSSADIPPSSSAFDSPCRRRPARSPGLAKGCIAPDRYSPPAYRLDTSPAPTIPRLQRSPFHSGHPAQRNRNCRFRSGQANFDNLSSSAESASRNRRQRKSGSCNSFSSSYFPLSEDFPKRPLHRPSSADG